MLKSSLIIAALLIAVLSSLALGQECRPPAIVANTGANNIFSPEQEMILGELVYQRQARDFRQISDAALQRYVDELGQRIITHLPKTGLQFRFHIIDYPDANAFNIPGGHVYLTRKLIAFVKSEDELAGVIGHELGHATVHHGAVDLSDSMRQILNITSLGDRKDITEKYNLFMENSRMKRIKRKVGHGDDQQLEADRIGLFAMVAAGYDPNAFFAFFGRLTESDGKTGNWFSDIFGKAKPEQKRLREMQVLMEKMPQCRGGRKANAAEDFSRWQAEVVMYRETGRKEELPGLVWKRELQPKLRSDINHLAFSRDGKLLLAQDDFGVTIVDPGSLKVLFQIPVEGAEDAKFTPDGTNVVFTTSNLRYERWSVAEQKPIEAREMVVRGDCQEHELSPDGNYLACVDSRLSITLIDTKTGDKVWEKKEFYQLSFSEYFVFFVMDLNDAEDTGLFRIEFSPDSRYVMYSRSATYLAAYYGTAVALDIPSLKTVGVDGDLKLIASRPYAFLDSQSIIGMSSSDPGDSGIFSFPGGKRLQKFGLGGRSLRLTENSNYVVVKPLVQTQLGLFDIKRGILVAGLNKEDITVFGDVVAFEAASGKIVLRKMPEYEPGKGIGSNDIGTVDLPANSIGNLMAANVADNFGWLALSSKNRGGLWNLATGERKMFLRGFRGAAVGDNGLCVSHFPKLRDNPQGLALMNPADEQVTAVREMPEKGGRQYGRFVLMRTSLNAKAESGKEEKKTILVGGEEINDTRDLSNNVRFELKDFIKDKVIWSRDFPKSAPRYSFDEFSGRIIFYWNLRSDHGKTKLKENPEMEARAAAMGDKEGDYLLEVVDAFAQKTVGMLLLETGKGSFYVRSGLSEGDWVVLYDSNDRVLVYSIKEGTLKHRFFGGHAAINPQRNQVAVENFPGEINLYDLTTGESQVRLVFNGEAAFVRFNLEGNKLFVLSDAQSAYSFDLNKMPVAKPNF